MKYIQYMLVVALLAGLTASCDSLDLYPKDYYGTELFWKNTAQVEGYMIGLHSNLREKYQMFYLMGEARGGTSRSGTSFIGTSINESSPIKTNTFSKHLTGISNWYGLYSNILNVNLFIQKVENECDFLSDDDRDYMLGQAYGLRAFYYFWLYRTYGGVPLVKEPTVMDGVTDAEPLYKERSSARQTFDFIKADIVKSKQMFAGNDEIKKEKGMWSLYATLMLKAEIYLWSAKVSTDDQAPDANDIQVAKKSLEGLIGKFTLLPDFADVFAYDNKGNDEIIFSIRFEDGEMTNWMENFIYSGSLKGQFFDENGQALYDPLDAKGTGLLRHEYKWGLFDAMDDADSRKETTFLGCYDEDGAPAGVALRKFMGIVNSNGNRSYCDDYVVYRYADVLLMMAEVQNMLGGDVASYINEVRQRAYAGNYDEQIHAYHNSTFAANELAILKERDYEFVSEGKRWFDVVRLRGEDGSSIAFSAAANYDDPGPVLSKTEAYKLLWPIDIETLNTDPQLKNNPGYEE